MIIIDPDLEPDPAPASTSAKRPSVLNPPEKSLNLRVPSARTLASFLAAAQAAVRVRGEVTVLLTSDNAIRDLNRRFRSKNKATDVLSFPAESPMPGASPEKIAGDLAISVPTALRQAVEQGHALSKEVKVLILHGLLHLAGYDHEADAGQMARRERLLRARLRLPQGLIERVSAKVPSPGREKTKIAQGGVRRSGRNPGFVAPRPRSSRRAEAKLKSGTDSAPGAPSLRLSSGARVGNRKPHSETQSTRIPSNRGSRP